ncbi:hypothetical protein QBC35DRAFT_239946 [Podospora australis]|uniref:Uncharacterized protein n=1 Tax=Podospora australis TaxID=1536484 RepID=A0AAN6WTI4_9PEZI|nr:hypothetical protein QBC35DRAFT_239946 [Podospora australis]
MFLHSAAALHGHEYSNRPSSSSGPQAPLRNPLLRSAFAPTKQRVTADGATPLVPVLRQRPASDCLPRVPSPIVRFREPQDAYPFPPTMPEEPQSESELSDAAPSTIDGTLTARSPPRRRRQRAPRRSTTYFLGYPAPRLLDKTKYARKVIPRLLLQLQKVSEDGRSRPVLEMFPASRIAGPLIAPRLAKRFPGIFGVKHHLGYDDIVLVRRDDDHMESDTTDPESEDALEKRRLLAVYSPLRHSDEAEIVLDDGSVWVARPLPNGSWDFVHTDDEGNMTTARWARRHKAPAMSVTGEPSTPSSVTAPHTRFTFSMINPLTRRHPVMATLTPSSLDVQDTYTSVTTTNRYPSTRHRSLSAATTSSRGGYVPPSPSQQSSMGFSTDGESDCGLASPCSLDRGSSQRTVHQVDLRTKMLISVTALWVALRAGWSPNHTPIGGVESITSTPAASAQRVGRGRRNTWGSRASTTSDAGRSPEPSTCVAESVGIIKRYSMPIQCLSEKGDSTSNTPVGSRSSTPVSNMSTNQKSAPRRATSTGAAYMQRRLQESSASGAAAEETTTKKNIIIQHTLEPSSQPTSPTPIHLGNNKLEAGGNVNRHSSITIKVVSPPNTPATAKPSPQHQQSKPDVKPSMSVKRSLSMMGGLGSSGSKSSKSKKGKRISLGAVDGNVGGETEKKNGVRSKLFKWIHKIGSR